MDMALYAIIMAKVKQMLIDGGNVTPEEREKIEKLIIDGLGDKYLADDGTYKDVSRGTTDYENLNNKPSINGFELNGNKNASQLGFSPVSMTGSYNQLVDLPTPIMYLSQLQNDTGFVTSTVGNLVNYYTKAQAYTKMEVNYMIGNLSTLSVQIVTVLPTENISLNTIYLIKDEGTGIYAQWMYLNNEWSNIGSTEINLDNYYTAIEVMGLLYNKVDKVFGMGLSQENYTTEEADKLAGLTNYTLPKATTEVLGGVSVDGTTIFVDENGVISTSGGGIPPVNVENIELTEGNERIIISWKDPEDIIIDGYVLSKWKGTKLIQKVGSYPMSPTDGTIIVDNQIRNNYENAGITITPLTNGITYYYQLFPYSDSGAINSNTENRISGTPVDPQYKIMTVIIDSNNSNPSTALTYADDALGMTPGSSSWDEWFGIYPCLLKDGIEIGKLNPNNFNQLEDGTTADISSGNSGDVMIAFPRRGVKIETLGSKVYISVTDNPDNRNFKYYAHNIGSSFKNILYIGGYKASLDTDKLRSLSGKSLATNLNLLEYRTYCKNNNINFKLIGFYQILLIQVFYTLKYKNLNSQSNSTIGMGYTGGANVSSAIPTGGTNMSGMNYGSSNDLVQMKLFGIEDVWGNKNCMIDGAYSTTEGFFVSFGEFDDPLSYSNVGIINALGNSFTKKIIGTTEMGFAPKDQDASSTTFFCDIGRSSVMTSGFKYIPYMSFVGSYKQTNTQNGIFNMYFGFIDTNKTIENATRIIYL